MEKKRILYIESNTDGTIGGSYYSLLYLLEGLNKERYIPIVLFCEENILVPKFKRHAEEVIIHNYDPFDANPFNTWKTIPRFFKHVILKQFALWKILKRVEPDLVHLNNGYNYNHEWVLACCLYRIPIIVHDRGARPPATLQTRFFVRFMDAIIPVSDANKKIIEDGGLRPKRIKRIYNGLDTEKLEKYKSPEIRNSIRNSLGIKDDEILIGMIGNIHYWKGQMVFAQAMNIIMKHHTNVLAVIIGKIPKGSEEYERKIRAFIAENSLNDRFKFLGFREDIPQLHNAIDIFVHASIEPEPFGRVVLEAMAMEKPIVATNSGGTPEQITDGESGLLVPMGDYNAMASALEKYLRDMNAAKEIGKRAFSEIKERFSISKMVKTMESVYEEIFSL